MGFFGEIGGIFPRSIEIASTSTSVTRLPRTDYQSEVLKSQALSTNHSSRDRGIHPLKASPTNRSRHGNAR